jgi:hypothetical protein
MKITVGTGWTGDQFKELGTFTTEMNRKYSQKQGYNFVLFDDENPPWYPKVPALSAYQKHLQKIALAIKHLKDCDWFLWVDGDACFVRHDSVEPFTDDKFFFVVSSGATNKRVMNTGVFLIKNCSESLELLNRLMDVTQLELKAWQRQFRKKWKDQAALYITLMKERSFMNGIKKIPYGKLWCHPKHIQKFKSVIVHANRCHYSETPSERLEKIKNALLKLM